MRRTLPILMLLALVSAACQIRVDTSITVNGDESGTFALEIGLDEELRELSEGQDGGLDFTSDLGDIPAGWSAEPFVDGEFEGTRLSTDFASFADLDAKLTELGEQGGETAPNELVDSLDFTHSGDSFSFRAELEQLDEGLVDASGGGLELDGLDPTQFLESLLEIRFLITLPGTIGDNNADLVDGNTLTWTVPLDQPTVTLFANSSGSGGSFLSPIVLAGLAVVVLGVAGFVWYRRRSAPTALPPALAETSAVPEVAQPTVPVEGDPFSV